VVLWIEPRIFFFFGCAGAWTQDLHLEPLHYPYFCEGFFEIGSRNCKLFPRGWLRTMILLVSASWVARITSMSHRHPAWIQNLVHVCQTHVLPLSYIPRPRLVPFENSVCVKIVNESLNFNLWFFWNLFICNETGV
jgi:hypothetical protein